MLCKDVMNTAIRSCQTDTTVNKCAQIMANNDVGFLPVVDGGGRLVGVVTDRDLTIRVIAQERSAWTRVAEVMHQPPFTCRPEDDLQLAEDRLVELKSSRVVVVDRNNRPLGVLSLSDLSRFEDEARIGQIFKGMTRHESRTA